jgi:hypothetical protein
MNTPAESKGVRQGTAHEQITESSLVNVSCRNFPDSGLLPYPAVPLPNPADDNDGWEAP